MPKVGVVLSGCGVYDGAEIHESVITMLALDRAGAEMELMAPNIDQLHVINHITGEEMEGEGRNVLIESARIARGEIKDIVEISGKDIDALIFPGGFGVAKNLCDYAMTGSDCIVNPDIYRLAVEMHLLKKPIGVICIAPAMMAKIIGEQGTSADLTIGNDEQTAKDINEMGANHVSCSVEKTVIDKEKKIVSTPAYMLAGKISDAADGIEQLVKDVLSLID